MNTLETSVYTVGERDLILELVDALHKGNEEVFTKKCKTDKDSNGLTCYNIVIECPERRHFDLSHLLGLALKIHNF